jgi:hypothetical protein
LPVPVMSTDSCLLGRKQTSLLCLCYRATSHTIYC